MTTSKSIRQLNLFLEWTGHGLLWIGFVSVLLIALLFSSNNNNTSSIQSYMSFQHVWWNWRSNSLIDEQQQHYNDEMNKNITKLFCLFIALLFDTIMVGIIKFLFQCERPKENNHSDMRLTVSIDAWSFPSGHASRSTMLYFLISYLWLSSTSFKSWFISGLLLAWNITLCYSRYAMHRHYFIDILAGYLLGYMEYWFIVQLFNM
ncbi:unnamed protein product [Schistosoma turkestanicum]|nr:unnamed protein product [Schistosoma turkestanicum]